MENLATKSDLLALRAEIRAELKAELSELKAELMKWMFLFWAGQMGATLAIVKFLK